MAYSILSLDHFACRFLKAKLFSFHPQQELDKVKFNLPSGRAAWWSQISAPKLVEFLAAPLFAADLGVKKWRINEAAQKVESPKITMEASSAQLMAWIKWLGETRSRSWPGLPFPSIDLSRLLFGLLCHSHTCGSWKTSCWTCSINGIFALLTNFWPHAFWTCTHYECTIFAAALYNILVDEIQCIFHMIAIP